MIDALFGSKTRVKLLHLFLSNPGKSFYVREITRLIGEQINSVRRELANMQEAEVVSSCMKDNKLYYEINQKYTHYKPLRSIFTDTSDVRQTTKSRTSTTHDVKANSSGDDWRKVLVGLSRAKVVVVAGALVRGSASSVDILIVGAVAAKKVNDTIARLEVMLGRELTFTKMSYDEFYYRLSVHDRFLNDILSNRHEVLIDSENILKRQK